MDKTLNLEEISKIILDLEKISKIGTNNSSKGNKGVSYFITIYRKVY